MCENCFSRKIYKTENLNFAMCILLKKNTFLVNIFFLKKKYYRTKSNAIWELFSKFLIFSNLFDKPLEE